MKNKMATQEQLPEIVLFGASLVEWSFFEHTRGFGWVLQEKYKGKAEILNEGSYTSTMLMPNFREIVERATRPYAAPTLLITIMVGGNDAVLMPYGEYVPLKEFEENIREWVETVLTEDNMPDTKIVLITPPPINCSDPPKSQGVETGKVTLEKANRPWKQGRGYKTYLSKKRYAEKVIDIAKSYEETGRVIGLNLWRALVDAGLADQGRLGDEDAYDEEKLPGCGLLGAKQFKDGYFTDGLHLDGLGYDVFSKGLLELVLSTWPELAPERIE
ncbi:SGNH hydrolase [Amniculicola lignicola CBS 123094]|uniref:SGNH hydrolase n=1 Tax=Amniculicola lignicola CBS 123094 TaxID=1392246 RepID=A0A6A5W1J8_9PLEO|nr:SGNH hydrolase [Amniculicola lignicola CBS 123094]